MGRPPKVKPPQGEGVNVELLSALIVNLTNETNALRADIRALAAYIADRDQLRPNAHGARIAEIALEQ